MLFQETISALLDIYETHKYTMCEKCFLTRCAFLHRETPKIFFRISRNSYLWKREQYKAVVRGARRLFQYCQLPGKISRDILRYIWSVCGISKILFIPSTTARETLASRIQITPDQSKTFFGYNARTDISIHHGTLDDIRQLVVHLETPWKTSHNVTVYHSLH